MKNIFLILMIVFLGHTLNAQQSILTLNDFSIKEITVPSQKSSYFLLTLKENEKITIKVSSKPALIASSFFDEKYLLIVFKGVEGVHFITGAYKQDEKWNIDYFEKPLHFSTGYSAQFLEKVNFINGETLFVKIRTQTVGKKEETHQFLYRICQNTIKKYALIDDIYFPQHGKNEIRPID